MTSISDPAGRVEKPGLLTAKRNETTNNQKSRHTIMDCGGKVKPIISPSSVYDVHRNDRSTDIGSGPRTPAIRDLLSLIRVRVVNKRRTKRGLVDKATHPAMKVFLIAALLFITSALAQNIRIDSPTTGQTLRAGQEFTAKLTQTVTGLSLNVIRKHSD
jgi:hypothetical protein